MSRSIKKGPYLENSLLKKILDANSRSRLYSQAVLTRILLDQLFLVCARDARFHLSRYRPFLRKGLRGALSPHAMASLLRRAAAGVLDDRRFAVNSPPASCLKAVEGSENRH